MKERSLVIFPDLCVRALALDIVRGLEVFSRGYGGDTEGMFACRVPLRSSRRRVLLIVTDHR